MTKLTIEHNWNSYSWIGDKWGEMTLGEQCKMRIWDAQVYFTFENWVVVNTYHSPDQLVKLWYMELQPQEEKTEETQIYIPSESELRELNFTYEDTVWFQMDLYPHFVYTPNHKNNNWTHWYFHNPIYPTSNKDIETLISLFSPND